MTTTAAGLTKLLGGLDPSWLAVLGEALQTEAYTLAANFHAAGEGTLARRVSVGLMTAVKTVEQAKGESAELEALVMLWGVLAGVHVRRAEVEASRSGAETPASAWQAPEHIVVGERQRKVYLWPNEEGCVSQMKIAWENSRRGKNWMATVAWGPQRMERAFWSGCGPGKRAIPDNLAPGTFVEVGADDYAASGKARPYRAFYRVLAVDAAGVWVREAEEPKKSPNSVEPEIAAFRAGKPPA